MAPKLSALLVQDRVVSFFQMDAAVQRQRQHGGRVGTALLELGYVDERTLLTYLGRHRGLPVMQADVLAQAEPASLRILTRDQVLALSAIPVTRRGERLSLAVTDPLDATDAAGLRRIIGYDIEQALCTEVRFWQAAHTFYGVPIPARFAELAGRLAWHVPTHNVGVALPERLPTRRLSLRNEAIVGPASAYGSVSSLGDQDPAHRGVGAWDRTVDRTPSSVRPVLAPAAPSAAPPAALVVAPALPADPLAWDLAAVSQFCQTSDDRDALLEAVLGFCGQLFTRRALLVVGRDRLRLYGERGFDASPAAGFQIAVPADSRLQTLCGGDAYFVGDPRQLQLESFWESRGATVPSTCAVLPVRAAGRAALLLVGDNETRPIDARLLPAAILLVHALRAALVRLIRSRKGAQDAVPVAEVDERIRVQQAWEGLLTANAAAQTAAPVATVAEGVFPLPDDAWDLETITAGHAALPPAAAAIPDPDPVAIEAPALAPDSPDDLAEENWTEVSVLPETDAYAVHRDAGAHQLHGAGVDGAEPDLDFLVDPMPASSEADFGLMDHADTGEYAAVAYRSAPGIPAQLPDHVAPAAVPVPEVDAPALRGVEPLGMPPRRTLTLSAVEAQAVLRITDELRPPTPEDLGLRELDAHDDTDITAPPAVALDDAPEPAQPNETLLFGATRRDDSTPFVAAESTPPESVAVGFSRDRTYQFGEASTSPLPRVDAPRLVTSPLPQTDAPLAAVYRPRTSPLPSTGAAIDATSRPQTSPLPQTTGPATPTDARPQTAPLPQTTGPAQAELASGPAGPVSARTLTLDAALVNHLMVPLTEDSPEEDASLPLLDIEQVLVDQPEDAPPPIHQTLQLHVDQISSPEGTAAPAPQTVPVAVIGPVPPGEVTPEPVALARAPRETAPRIARPRLLTSPTGEVVLEERHVSFEVPPIEEPSRARGGHPTPVALDVYMPGVLQPPSRPTPRDPQEQSAFETVRAANERQLVALLDDASPRVRDSAFVELLARGPRAFDALFAIFPGPLQAPRRECAAAGLALESHGPVVWLIALQLRALVPRLGGMLDHDDPDTRWYAAELVARTGDPTWLRVMAPLLFDRDDGVRRTSQHFVELQRHTQQAREVAAYARQRLADADPWIIEAAIGVCGMLRDTDAVPALIEVLDHSSEHTRRVAATALTRLTFREFGPYPRPWQKWYERAALEGRNGWLLSAMIDPDRRVRENVARELRGIPRLVVNYDAELDRRALLLAHRTVEQFFARSPSEQALR